MKSYDHDGFGSCDFSMNAVDPRCNPVREAEAKLCSCGPNSHPLDQPKGVRGYAQHHMEVTQATYGAPQSSCPSGASMAGPQKCVTPWGGERLEAPGTLLLGACALSRHMKG